MHGWRGEQRESGKISHGGFARPPPVGISLRRELLFAPDRPALGCHAAGSTPAQAMGRNAKVGHARGGGGGGVESLDVDGSPSGRVEVPWPATEDRVE